MVWGAIAIDSWSRFALIRGCMTIVQCMTSCHTCHFGLEVNGANLLQWTPRCPDLSPREHIWDMMR